MSINITQHFHGVRFQTIIIDKQLVTRSGSNEQRRI